MKMLKIEERDLYQLLIAEFRYAVKRDNHLAPSTCIQHVKDYLPKMSKEWRAHTADQLTNEIIQERVWSHAAKPRLSYDSEWEALLDFLVDYLERLPANVDKYMNYLFNKPTWEANIDYYSTETHNKIIDNKNRDDH